MLNTESARTNFGNCLIYSLQSEVVHIFKDLAIQTLSGKDKLETSISDDEPANQVKITNASQMNPSWENRSGESYICDASVCCEFR